MQEKYFLGPLLSVGRGWPGRTQRRGCEGVASRFWPPGQTTGRDALRRVLGPIVLRIAAA